MSDDAELLRRYAAENSEAAFAALVRQHLGLVYHTALRHLDGDAHAAQDVAQAVFTDLARKAPTLAGRPLLAGWLHTSARYAALQHRRAARRRQIREQESHLMQESSRPDATAVEWSALRDVIDEALHALNARDREAVLLRFFEGRDFADVAARLNLSPGGARTCVERALGRMRARLARRGVASTVAALSSALAAHGAAEAPATLAASIARTALSEAAAGGVAAGGGFLALMKTSSLVLAGSLAANAVLGVLWFAGAPPSPAALAPAPALAAKPASPGGSRGAAEPSLTDPVAIGRWLLAAGYSDRVVTAAVGSAVAHELREPSAVRRIRRWNPTPQPSIAIAPGFVPPRRGPRPPTAEARRRTAALAELGYDDSGVPFASLFRNLSAEKARAVRRIEEDYSEIRGEIAWGGAAPQRRADGPARQAALRKTAAQFEADLRTVLTPDEATDYFRHHSPAGQRVARLLAAFPVSAEAHAAIADAALAVEAAQLSPDIDRAWPAAEVALHEAYRRGLGDEDFLALLPRLPLGHEFAPVDALYREAGFSTAARAGLFSAFAGYSAARTPAAAGQAYAALVMGAGLDARQVAAFDATPLGQRLKREIAATTPAPSP